MTSPTDTDAAEVDAYDYMVEEFDYLSAPWQTRRLINHYRGLLASMLPIMDAAVLLEEQIYDAIDYRLPSLDPARERVLDGLGELNEGALFRAVGAAAYRRVKGK